MSALPVPLTPHEHYLPPLPAGVTQSDDQFYVWDQAIKNGWSVNLYPGLLVRIGVTLPFEFEGTKYHTYKPFDAGLHRLADYIRSMT